MLDIFTRYLTIKHGGPTNAHGPTRDRAENVLPFWKIYFLSYSSLLIISSKLYSRFIACLWFNSWLGEISILVLKSRSIYIENLPPRGEKWFCLINCSIKLLFFMMNDQKGWHFYGWPFLMTKFAVSAKKKFRFY